MINVLIVEDEFTIALDIEQRLLALGYNSVGIASSYNQALPFLVEKTHIDIAILDINLGEGKSGIELGNLIKDKFNIPIIFLTAYSDDETFNKAEKVKPYGYIIKPFNDSDINRTIKIALQKFSEINTEKEDVSTKKNTNYLFIKDKGSIIKILIDSILWLEAMDNYTIIYDNKAKHIVNMYLKDVLSKLNNAEFIRIHKSFAVSISKITSIEGNTIFIGDKHLSVSRKYKKELFDKINII